MTSQMKPAHYVYSDEMKARYKADVAATPEAFSRRELAFGLLEGALAPPEAPSLVSSTYGPIEAVLMTLPSYVFSEPAYREPIKGLLATLPSTCHYYIFVSAAGRPLLESWLAGLGAQARATIVEAPPDMKFTVWAEDAYAAVRDLAAGRRPVSSRHLVEPATFLRAHDAWVADEMARSTVLFQSQVRLYFQGGNILVGDDFWLLGLDYAVESLRLEYVVPKVGETEMAAIGRAYGEALDGGRTMRVIGSSLVVPAEAEIETMINGEHWRERVHRGNRPGTSQPLFHIDMFLTLAGRTSDNTQIVLVGDPKAAADLLNMPLSEYAMQPVFDDIARKLAAAGFEVLRNPLPLVYQDDAEKRIRYWYFATSNNALVQTVEDGNEVWLPTYGHGAWQELQVTDEANAEIWSGLGYTVHRVGDFHPFAFNLGAVHCITKYLGRTV